MLRSLDLFSGIGGITKALEGMCEPVMYCEINEDARDVLKTNIFVEWLPAAPIVADVRDLRLPEEHGVDMIVGGWPCQDISCCGMKRGLAGERSGLLKEVLRIAKDHAVPALFLENVAAFAGKSHEQDFEWTMQELERLGYVHRRWCIASADEHSGAPHLRRRFFLLAMREGEEVQAALKQAALKGLQAEADGSYQRFRWTEENEPAARLVPVAGDKKLAGELLKKHRLLGNSVVPDCVRVAFIALALGENGGPPKMQPQCRWPRNRVRLDPGLCPVPDKPSPFHKLPLLEAGQLVIKPLWATPRTKAHAARVLSQRTMNDLPTQVRFAVDTNASNCPGGSRLGAAVNPEWLEWLMGYPAKWTDTVVTEI